jgi:predicted GH43/DUF377 family glycosyl hydrolase
VWAVATGKRWSSRLSHDGDWWDDVGLLQRPRRSWEAVQLGTGAPPLATPEGWLVITHGVGAVRHYALGAMLLDLDDPLRVRGVLAEPLLVPTEEEQIGYVPNVLYTCGALLHGDLLVLPYACSDAFIRFAVHPLEPLLDRLLQSPQPLTVRAGLAAIRNLSTDRRTGGSPSASRPRSIPCGGVLGDA